MVGAVMAKFTKASKPSKWGKYPHTIGQEGPEFLPDPFGEKRASGPKTVATGIVKAIKDEGKTKKDK
jgi:hypothetical protein